MTCSDFLRQWSFHEDIRCTGLVPYTDLVGSVIVFSVNVCDFEDGLIWSELTSLGENVNDVSG